jgi:hypothetical protein
MRKSEHDCPHCVCGLTAMEWSDRERWVDANDPDEVANTIVMCALDHSYDRFDGVPYGWWCSDEKKIELRIVVAKHLSAVDPEWRDTSIIMNDVQRAALKADLIKVLKP